jgi:hypothetical protein
MKHIHVNSMVTDIVYQEIYYQNRLYGQKYQMSEIYTKIINNDEMNNRMFEYLRDFDYDFVPEDNRLGQAGYSNSLLGLPQFDEFVKIVEKFGREKSMDILEGSHAYKDFNRGMKIFTRRLYVRSQRCHLMWGMKQSSDEAFAVHDHWPSTWSFTYYLNPPKGAAGLYFPEYDKEIPIEHGLLILFKGDVMHGVKKSTYEGYRYCIAGNISPTFT